MKKYFFLPLSLFLFSCGANESEAPDDDLRTDTVSDRSASDEPTEIHVVQTCYVWSTGKDSITLKIEQTGTVVTGQLNYVWFEKDSNRGTIKGEMRGDTLVADYTFMAEGMESVRKEFFLKKGDVFVIGQIDYEHDKEPYQAKNAKFTGEKLVPMTCQ
jgi:hypothetical protein